MFEKIGASDKLRIFEGPPTGRRPVFRVSNLSSGLLKVIGKMVGHSFLMDGQGFPYLSQCCYYYMCGCNVDEALSLVREEDLSENVKTLVSDVSNTMWSTYTVFIV